MATNFLNKLYSGYAENTPRINIIICAFVLLLLLTYRVLLIFSYNGEIGGIDNNFVYGVLRSLQGYTIYPNPSELPYAVNMYPPLYYNLCTFFGKLVHINTDDPISVYRLCRTVSLLCDCLTGYIVYVTLFRNLNISKEVSFFFLSVLLCILCNLGYTFSRCDSLFLTLYAAVLYLITKKTDETKTGLLAALAFLSVASIVTKQTGIVLPLLIILWFLLKKEWKKSIYYLLIFLSCFAVTLFIYISLFDYSYLFAHTVKALNNRVDLAWFYVYIFNRSVNSLWILVLYAAFILAMKGWIKSKTWNYKLLAGIFLIQFLFSFLTSLKWGSSAGYFNESFVVATLLISYRVQILISDGIENKWSRKIVPVLIPISLIFFIHTITQGYLFFIQKATEKKAKYIRQKEVKNYLVPKTNNRYVLHIGSQNTDFFKTLLSRKIAIPNTDIVECCTFPDNTFDYSGLSRDIKNGKISFIITSEKTPLQEYLGIPLNLQKDTTIAYYTIYSFQKKD